MVKLRFWWDGANPEGVLDDCLLDFKLRDLEFEVWDTSAQMWRDPKGSILDVAEWMADMGKRVVRTLKLKHDQAGNRWRGLYLLEVA